MLSINLIKIKIEFNARFVSHSLKLNLALSYSNVILVHEEKKSTAVQYQSVQNIQNSILI